MFEKNYSAENAIRNWAKAFMYIAIGVAILSFIAALIVLYVNARFLWWISLIILGGGFALTIPLVFIAHMSWGFAEIIKNTQNSAKSINDTNPIVDVLPEL